MLNVLVLMVILLTWRGLLRSWVWILAGADAADHVDVFFESSSLYSKVMKCLVWVVMSVGSIFIVTQVNPFDFAGPVLMLSLFVVTRWLGQAMTGQEALGLGDVKLAMTIGWFSGVDGGLLACGLACCSGTAEALCRSGLDLKKDFAFGSHLCGAWMIVMLWQQLL
jgi:prepilin signal peptidase PulO-like enzyme (type II secretory pathway)